MTHDETTRTGHEEPERPELTALLREAYAPPAGDLYWKGLERRIMAQVREQGREDARSREPDAWWMVLAQWRGVGLVAATLALLLTGALVAHEQRLAENARQLAAGAAYYTVFDGPSEAVSVAFTVPARGPVPAEAPERYLDPLEP
jgi:hypothetical protein